jgi:hypothetical protein
LSESVVGWNSVAYSTMKRDSSRGRVEYATLFHPTTNIFYPELSLVGVHVGLPLATQPTSYLLCEYKKLKPKRTQSHATFPTA